MWGAKVYDVKKYKLNKREIIEKLTAQSNVFMRKIKVFTFSNDVKKKDGKYLQLNSLNN